MLASLPRYSIHRDSTELPRGGLLGNWVQPRSYCLTYRTGVKGSLLLYDRYQKNK